MQDLIDSILNDELFGYLKLTINVPEHLIDKYSEFLPIFKNAQIDLQDIGDLMQDYCKKIG